MKSKKFKILKKIPKENCNSIGICEIIPQNIDLGGVIEYKSNKGIFYTNTKRLSIYKAKGLIEYL